MVLNAVLEDSVHINIGSRTVADAFRQDDTTMRPVPRGAYGPDPADPYLFRVPFTGTAEVTISLCSAGGRTNLTRLETEALAIYMPSDEISLFSLTGRRFGSGQAAAVPPGTPCLVWLGEGLELRLSPGPASPLMPRNYESAGSLIRLPLGWSGDLTAVFPEWEQEPLWTNRAVKDPTLSALPDWAKEMRCEFSPLPNDHRVGLRVICPPDVEVVRVRFAGQSFIAADDDSLYGCASPARLPVVVMVDLWLKHQDGQACRLQRPCLTPRVGVAYYRKETALDGWQICELHRAFPVSSISGNALRVLPPGDWTETEVGYLFEGLRSLGPVPLGISHRSAGFLPPSGWGAALSIRPRRYNQVESPVMVTDAVIDPGVLGKPLIDGSVLRLPLSSNLTPGPDFTLHLWNATGDEAQIECGNVQAASPREWSVDLQAEWEGQTVYAVAVSYKGVRTGARALPGFNSVFPRWEIEGEAAARTAALLRWLRLPLLQSNLLPAVKKWRDRAGATAIHAWVRGLGLPPHLIADQEHRGWPSVLRQLVADWRPSGSEAWLLLGLLHPAVSDSCRLRNVGDVPERVGKSLAVLLDVSPDLALAVARAYWHERLLPQRRAWTAKDKSRYADKIRVSILQAVEESFRLDLQGNASAVAVLTEAISRQLQVDSGFVGSLLTGSQTTPVQKLNHGCAIEVSPELRALIFLKGWDAIAMEKEQ